ncbi:Nvl [Symbiodinium microadriaticum]|nr:Nvl [Symbiodinium microadriaticum]
MGTRIYMRASDGTKGPLRDVVERQKLEAYIRTYGDFDDLWMPWKAADLRPFGFVTFKESAAARGFVEWSPHKVPEAEVEIIAKWGHGAKKAKANGSLSASNGLEGMLQPLEVDADVSLEKYHAGPEQKRDIFTSILRSQDPSHQERLARSSRLIRGREVRKSKPRLHLFCGPPATGKTQAMKVIAAEAGLKAFQMKLGEVGYDSPTAFQDSLKEVDKMASGPNGVGVAVIIDEAEQIFSRRSDMQSAFSVKVEGKKEIVRAFLEWTDGLQSRPRDAKPIVIVLSTNLRDSIDEAVQSRVGKIINFSRPTFAQCKQHFAANAPKVRRWHWLLAASSRLLFMDFRELEAVHDLVCERDAEKSEVEGPQGEVTAFSDYLPAIRSVWLQRRRAGWKLMDVLSPIIWKLPYFSYHMRVVREEADRIRQGLRARL